MTDICHENKYRFENYGEWMSLHNMKKVVESASSDHVADNKYQDNARSHMPDVGLAHPNMQVECPPKNHITAAATRPGNDRALKCFERSLFFALHLRCKRRDRCQ
jgi:hypothetical protein